LLNWLYAVFTFEVAWHVNYFAQLGSKGKSMKGEKLMLETILIVLVILVLVGVLR
jgi:hypothetical protein